MLVRGEAAQHIAHTTSRRTGPRRWLRAVQWAIAAGHHPKANATTVALAEDLAARMDYDTGHVRYALDATTDRLGLSRSCVTSHARYLRELGLLAWVSKGTRHNIRRVLGLGGYAGTATVYAAVIPAAYDHAMGHRIHGTGYEARVVVDLRDRPKPVDNSSGEAVDNPASGSSWTPSLTVVKKEDQVQVVGGVTTTAQRADKNPAPKKPTILGRAITAAIIETGDRLARAVRRRVPWLRKASHDQLRWVLSDLAAMGWTEQQTVAWLAEMAADYRGAGLLWQPARPHALIAHALRQEQERRQQAAQLPPADACVDSRDNAAWMAEVERRNAEIAALEALFGGTPERTDADRAAAREEGWQDFGMVADHYQDDPEDALDLYGHQLVSRAVRMAASGAVRF